jgi:hypothetical protein
MVLVGVRDPKSNPRHPNVVSTITGRIPSSLVIPSSLAMSVLQNVRLEKVARASNLPEHLESTYIARSYETVSSRSPSDEVVPLFFMVQGLISKKVLQWRPEFEAHVISVVRGRVMYDKSEVAPSERKLFKRSKVGREIVYSEMLNMIGVEVVVENGCNFPVSNEPYSKFAWVTQDQFMEMVDNRSTEPVSVALGTDAMMYCVKGLCLLSAHAALAERE